MSAETVGDRDAQAERVIAAIVDGDDVVDCETVVDHPSRFDCVAAIPPARARGSRGGSGQGGGLLVARAYAQATGDGWDEEVELTRRFIVRNAEGQERELITEYGLPSDSGSSGTSERRTLRRPTSRTSIRL